jgi:hypothetical protein
MILPRSRIPAALTLIMGVFLGWGLSSFRPVPLRAGAGDRSGEAIVATGPVHMEFDETVKASIPLEALYFLDYKGGRLLGTVPSFRQTAVSTKLIDTFAERDLVADFKLDLDIGPRPHFLMTTGALGAYSAGWAPLYVFETTSSQLAIYRMQLPQTVGTTVGALAQAKFDLVELRSYAKAGTANQQP